MYKIIDEIIMFYREYHEKLRIELTKGKILAMVEYPKVESIITIICNNDDAAESHS